MTDWYPYAELAEDPTTEFIVSWVDDSGQDEAGDTQHLVFHPEDDPDDERELDSEFDEVPESGGVYRHRVHVDDLEPATLYEGTIECHSGFVEVEFKTLPETLDGDDIRVCTFSDVHIDYEDGHSMEDIEQAEAIGDRDPDVVLINGDVVSNGDSTSESNTDWWLTWWSDYMDAINGENNRLRPAAMVPGNHEVGNGSGWTGSTSESVSPETGYIQFWFTNVKDLDPVGENYGAITVGDYLQFLALDTHSAHTETVADWAEDAIDPDVNVVLPFYHNPMFQGGSRSSSDDDLSERMREEWGPVFADAGNVYGSISGHIHVRKRTHPWTVVDEEPDGDHYETADGRYITTDQDSESIIEFGDGWRESSSRSPLDEWYLETSNVDLEHFYTIDISTQSEMSMDVNTFTDGGDVHNSETFSVGGYDTDDPEEFTGEQVRVGVIDSGHNVHETINLGEDGDGDPHWNVRAGKDFISGEEIDLDSEDFDAIEDPNGHGTFVASQIAHVDDGVAPDADLVIARALDEDGQGSTADIVDAVSWCADEGADVLCMSLGSPIYSEAMASEIEHVLEETDVKAVCVAVGNDRHVTRWVNSPADTLDYAIGVAATNAEPPEDAQSAHFSNVGPDDGMGNLSLGETRGASPWVAAPGMNIQCEVADDRGVLGTEVKSGTSMAAPIVAGAIARLLDREQDLDYEEIRERVARTAEPIPRAAKTEVGHGMINVENLINDTEPSEDQMEAMEAEAAARDSTHRSVGGGGWL